MHRTLLSTRILPAFLAGTTPSVRPGVLLVAGAPGSGKTTTADRLTLRLDRRAVRICADLLKAEHPAHRDALAVDEYSAGLVVRTDTRRWQHAVADHARRLRADVVEEIALDDPQHLRTLSAAYRFAGYRVVLLVLDVPDALGQLRLTGRHLREDLADGAVRYVAATHRALCAGRLPDTLAVAEAERLADKITVLGVKGRVLYRNVLSGGVWAGPLGAAAAVTAARREQWDIRVQEGFGRAAAAVARLLREERLADHRRQAGTQDLEEACLLAARHRPVPETGQGYGCLPHGQRQRIFERDIVPLHLAGITAHEDPQVIYVMSQPGGSKSTLSRDILNRLAVRAPTLISSDFLKAAHPDHRRLRRDHPREAGAIIRPDYQYWRDQAEAYVRERRGDAVIEIAPGSPEDFFSGAARFAAAGYRITLVLVAVRAADSRQATARRYLHQIRQGAPAPRFTTARGHDQCFTAVTRCAELATGHPPINSIEVVTRDGHRLHPTSFDPAGSNTPGRAPAALEAERVRPYTRQEAERFHTHQDELRAHLPEHLAELDTITALAAPLLPADMRPHTTG